MHAHFLEYCLHCPWQIWGTVHQRRKRRRRRFRASASTFRLIWILLLHIVVKCVGNSTSRFRCAFCSTDGSAYDSAHTSYFLWIFPISEVIQGCLSECLGVINFTKVRLYHCKTVGMVCFVFDFILYSIFILHQCAVARIRPLQSLIDMTCTLEVKETPESVQGV
jgi:hypothetical protein